MGFFERGIPKAGENVAPAAVAGNEGEPKVKGFGDAKDVQELLFMLALRTDFTDSQGNRQGVDYVKPHIDDVVADMEATGVLNEEILVHITSTDGLRGAVRRLVQEDYDRRHNSVDPDFILDIPDDMKKAA